MCTAKARSWWNPFIWIWFRAFGCWKVVLWLTEAFTSIVVLFLGGFAKDLIDIIIFRLLLLHTFFLNRILLCFYLHRARPSFTCFLIFLHKTTTAMKSDGRKMLGKDTQSEGRPHGFPGPAGQASTSSLYTHQKLGLPCITSQESLI